VKELREIYKGRETIGEGLSSIESALRDLTTRNPALARVQAPQYAAA